MLRARVHDVALELGQAEKEAKRQELEQKRLAALEGERERLDQEARLRSFAEKCEALSGRKRELEAQFGLACSGF